MNFLFYYSIDSPDFDDYYIYLEYLANNISSTGREQGLFYYYLQSWYFYLFNSGFEDPTFLTYLHRSIQQVNFYLYVLGLIGFFILFKNLTIKQMQYCTLIFLNFLPLSIMQLFSSQKFYHCASSVVNFFTRVFSNFKKV